MAALPGMYRGPTTMGKRRLYLPASTPTLSWYSISTVIAWPGPMLATDDVKMFGQRMINDHSQDFAALQQLAAAKGVTLPTEITHEQMEEAQRLARLSAIPAPRPRLTA